MTTIELSFVRLLREVCEHVHMDVPPCVVSADTEGKYLAYIDVHIRRNESIVELIRCWSSPTLMATAAEEEASRRAVKKLVQELDLHIKDVNYDDAIFYKNLSDQLTTSFATFSNQYNKLVWEYNFLKECYVSTTAEKNELVAERLKIQDTIQECNAMITRHPLPVPVTTATLSDIVSPSLGSIPRFAQ